MFKQYWNRIEKLWSFRSTSAYLAHLRKTGMRIGEGTEVFARTTNILIDTTRPWLIEIGRNVQLTAGVKILTHGYDWAVLKPSTAIFTAAQVRLPSGMIALSV